MHTLMDGIITLIVEDALLEDPTAVALREALLQANPHPREGTLTGCSHWLESTLARQLRLRLDTGSDKAIRLPESESPETPLPQVGPPDRGTVTEVQRTKTLRDVARRHMEATHTAGEPKGSNTIEDSGGNNGTQR